MRPAPLLLLPGTLCNAALWSGLALGDRVQIVPVLRGNTLAETAERVLENAPERVQLVGFSLGAIVAFEVLRRAPERIERLILLSANPHAPTEQQLSVWAEQEREVRNGQFPEVAGRLAGSAGQHFETALAMALEVGPQIFLEQLELLRSRPDSRPDLANWQGPLTILVGENDTVTPPALAYEMAELVPQAELHIIPKAGHFLPLDAPQAVSQALKGAVHV